MKFTIMAILFARKHGTEIEAAGQILKNAPLKT